MWPYTPVMGPRRSSSSASASAEVQAGPSRSPPSSPNLARVPSTYPAESYQSDPHPRTPRRRSVGLGISPSAGVGVGGLERVDESPSAPMRDLPVAVASPRSMTSDDDEDEGTGSENRLDSIDKDADQDQDGATPLPAHLVPPPSIHDTYLSRHIEPVVPVNSARPQAPRSTSVPVLPPITTTGAAAAAAGASLLPPADVDGKKGTGKPIFEIFDAEPGHTSQQQIKALKGHLADVLRVQEDIGRMHLGLEGLDAEADSLAKREKGVEDLMERLGTLSETLRTYHELGTPELKFPFNHDTHPGGPVGRGDEDPGESSTAAAAPHMTRLHSAHPDLGGPSTLHTSPPHKASPLSISTSSAQMQLQHRGVQDLKREAGHGAGIGGSERERKGSGNSNLSPLRLSTDDNPLASASASASAHPLRKKPSASFWDLEALKREREKRDDQWLESESGGGGGYRVEAESPKRSTSQRRRYDSPIEMVDRSRPW